MSAPDWTVEQDGDRLVLISPDGTAMVDATDPHDFRRAAQRLAVQYRANAREMERRAEALHAQAADNRADADALLDAARRAATAAP